jgi:beta-glucosidase-like glycosyl hydrolase
MNVQKVMLEFLKQKPELVSRVDESVRRILELKQRMGLLDSLRAPAKAGAEASSARVPPASPQPE